MLMLSFAFLLLAVGAYWLTTVHPARNVMRMRWTLVSFFLLMGFASFGTGLMLSAHSDSNGHGPSYPVETASR
ncbi:hypothetical protein [Aquimonas sp.]|jgi:hypothetical protein|uniref:hypothetical protein n=1 Tax=Aquimonas sp. TaxID=1872588 RepID=UPI0037C109E3